MPTTTVASPSTSWCRRSATRCAAAPRRSAFSVERSALGDAERGTLNGGGAAAASFRRLPERQQIVEYRRLFGLLNRQAQAVGSDGRVEVIAEAAQKSDLGDLEPGRRFVEHPGGERSEQLDG